MITDPLYQTDPYARDAEARVIGHTPEGGILCDTQLFYPKGGGQPGDSGWIDWDGQTLAIATAIKGDDGVSVLVPAQPDALPPKGAHVALRLDWERRHRHMRVHTALHVLSVVIPLPVTGGSISATGGRLDFAMPEPPSDKVALEDALNAMIDRDLPVLEQWISQADLDANPGLIKTLGVKPPRGTGRVRLVQIGQGDDCIDLQPCGGTHVSRTGEIGRVRLGKIENKGKQNRRVNLHLEL